MIEGLHKRDHETYQKSGLYDLKHTLGGIDDAIQLGEQWQAALRYWYNCVLNNLDGYVKSGRIGVVTLEIWDRCSEPV